MPTHLRAPVSLILLLATGGLPAACGNGNGAPDAALPDAATPDAATPDAAVPDAGVPTAHDYEGMWLISALTIPTEEDPLTFTRDGIPVSVRGDAHFAAVDATTATLRARQAVLQQSLLTDQVDSVTIEVTLERDRWLMDIPDDGVTVFDAQRIGGERLVLTWDADDPRNTADSPPIRIVLDRVEPWTTSVVGEWDIVSIEAPNGIALGECAELQEGIWWTVEMSISFDEQLVFAREMVATTYPDDECAEEPIETHASVQKGMTEEEGEALLRLWGIEEDGSSEFLTFTLALEGDELTLTRTACLPSPDCDDEAPTEVVVRRLAP